MVKTPVTSKSKTSKSGKLKLHPSAGTFSTISSTEMPKEQFAGYIDALELVFENGEIIRTQTFDEIREIADGYLQVELNKKSYAYAS